MRMPAIKMEQDDQKVVQRLVECGWFTKFQQVISEDKIKDLDSQIIFWRDDELNYVRYFSRKDDGGYFLITCRGDTERESLKIFLELRARMWKAGFRIKLDKGYCGLEFHENN